MPQKVKCKKCSFILYRGDELKSPEDILQMHEGKCPKCGNEISLSPNNLKVEASKKRSIRGYSK